MPIVLQDSLYISTAARAAKINATSAANTGVVRTAAFELSAGRADIVGLVMFEVRLSSADGVAVYVAKPVIEPLSLNPDPLVEEPTTVSR